MTTTTQQWLFSYGTLRQREVQVSLFGRALEGRADAMAGYRLSPLLITDPGVIATSGTANHTVARETGNPADEIQGTAFSVTDADLAAADAYEVDCKRITVRLKSGIDAFIYVLARPPAPTVECDQLHAGIAVRDLRAAIDFYVHKLGFFEAFTWGTPATFAGVNLGHVQVFLEQGTPTPNPNSAAAYFLVDDVDRLHAFHCASGVEIAAAIGDREYGIRDYSVRDLDGYCLVFGQHLMKAGPPIPIQRVDVPVRLEKRLAALLQDLAAHKRMDVNSCVEEILLHTNDGVGPHTKSQLRYIQELKKKHGIDYDSHASYRFVEE